MKSMMNMGWFIWNEYNGIISIDDTTLMDAN